jgi:TP901 family phage tail tape measure protein
MGVAAMKVPTIFLAVDRFSDVVTRMTAKTSAFGATAEAAAMRTSRSFNRAGTNMLGAGVGMAVGIGYAVNEAVKFEKAMANVSTTIDSTPQLMKQMSNSVLDMSKKIPVPISQLTEALYDVVSAGIDARYSMIVLKQSALLGVSGLGTTKEAVDVITSSLNSFNLKATESSKVANMVFKAVKYGKTTVSGIAESFGSSSALIKNSNVSLAEYLATTAVLSTTGMTASRAQTQISSAVTALIKPSGTMSKIFQKLGVKDVPAWIKSNGSLVKSLQIVRDEGERMGLLSSKAFGRKEGFSAMLSLLGPLAEKYKVVMNDIVGGTDSMTDAVAKQQATLAAKIQLMKNNLTILAIRVGDVLIPRIKDLVDSILPVVQSVTVWAQRNKGFANTLMTIAKWLLIIGVASKVLGVLFYGVSKAIAVASMAMRAYTFVSTLAALSNVSLGKAIVNMVAAIGVGSAPVLGFTALFLAQVAALGLVVYMFNKTRQTVANFGNQNALHLKLVTGNYETMEQRIAASNARIVENMKKFKMDLKSVEKTGKTIAELEAGRIAKTISFAKAKTITDNTTKVAASTKVAAQRIFVAPKAMNDTDTSFNEIMATGRFKNLAGTQSVNTSQNNTLGGTLKLEITTPNGVSTNVDDKEIKGIKIVLKENQGNR